MSFLLILVEFLEKWKKSENLGNFGVLRHGVGIPRSGMAEREAWTKA